MNKGKAKGSIKPRKRRKVDESPKNHAKKNETDTQIGNETDNSVERNLCSRSDYLVEFGKWLMSRKTRTYKGPVKESENEREEEQKIFSSLLLSGMEKTNAVSPFMEPDQCEENGVSKHVRRTDNEASENVESDEEEVVVRRRRRKSSGIVTKGLSYLDVVRGG